MCPPRASAQERPSDDAASEHERLFVDHFIVPDRRERWRMLLSSKRRQKIVRSFDGTPEIVCRDSVLIDVTRCQHQAEALITRLAGNPMTYLMSGDTRLDQRMMSLAEALNQRNDYGYCISIFPGRLAFWISEAFTPTSYFILVSDPKQRDALKREIRIGERT